MELNLINSIWKLTSNLDGGGGRFNFTKEKESHMLSGGIDAFFLI